MNQALTIQARHAGRSKQLDAVRRWAPLIGGSALALFGLSRRSKSGVAVASAGALLAYYGNKAASLPDNFVGSASVIVNAPIEQVFQFWRDFEDLPLFMRHLESVTVTGDRRSKWVALGPLGKRVEWDAEITNERQNESISWESLPGSDIEVNGSVKFQSSTGNRGTLINAGIEYRVPGGPVGFGFAKLLGKNPSFLMEQDLRRFKAFLETGEIPTVEGQSHGPRDRMTGVARVLDPDQGIARDVPLTQAIQQKRRAS